MDPRRLQRAPLEHVRRSEHAAKAVLDELAPSNLRGAVVRILADAIERANEAKPDCWGVRVNRDSLMLKVGRIEVIQVLPGALHCVVLSKVVRPQFRRLHPGALSGPNTGYVAGV